MIYHFKNWLKSSFHNKGFILNSEIKEMFDAINLLKQDIIQDFRKSFRNYLFGELCRNLINNEFNKAHLIIDKINSLDFAKDEFLRTKKTENTDEDVAYKKRYNPITGKYWTEKVINESAQKKTKKKPMERVKIEF